ncbi:hypothetical protein PGUG_00412 [Meyerozyma guilliermondii ATCC 6260]|uniref:Transcriptional protein SWT1 n=1 Tax=Meyerozyma guilliermondii (strain ATCC 6260 / CBS 566 / DSM 6381 / JCM 1539 / NBRC 10279 / NRRL Y-324) TaxID=294746 RepID=A5DAV7_PICGU|nr:uncharacterized protein PGUG_00412 [Meyerozyma guilliermondii ATCC 6260]EDK36314.2 hypothetical protein PGUG_00412 [Meyerozyma guilliermondii ATCC 6260]
MLPSKYALGGLSSEQSSKTVTVGRRRPVKPVNYVLKTIESRVNSAADKSSEDIEMVPMDDFSEVEAISDYVVHRRNQGLTSDEVMDLDLEDAHVSPSALDYAYLVVDTNFLLSHLNILDDLKKTGSKYKLKVVVPMAAIKELDGLKKSTRIADLDGELSGKSVGHLARWANDWIYAALATNSDSVVGQKMSQVIDKFATQDDAILDCCLFYQKTYPSSLVVLLSNDKNLCMKALTNEVLTVSYRPKMTAKLIGEMVLNENQRRNVQSPRSPIDLLDQLHNHSQTPEPVAMESNNHVKADQDIKNIISSEIQKLTIGAVDKCMRTAYGDDLDLIRDYERSNIRNLNDVLRVLELFWLPVFSSYLKRSKISFQKSRVQENTKFAEVPHNQADLIAFVGFWSEILKRIYEKEMNQTENNALAQLTQRWRNLAQNSG